MAKKVKIDVDELTIAIKEFNNIAELAKNRESVIGFGHVSVSEHWEGEAAKEFLNKLGMASVDEHQINELAKALANYCEKMKAEGEWMDSWLYKFWDYITFWD